ncbi:DUF998 domain-containing protein [Cohnella caldifontis]|uniref:DUF998 domain-containing protein n=1 Tax=Cohnella caldifontis TaxID=3027471 RepID=UPI0023EDA859|nr:DUF998 domain-containing protein [Cohnella sp. YIM B05605]
MVRNIATKLSFASMGLFLLILLGLHVLEPEFDPTWRFISEYALGPYGWLMHLSFSLVALGSLCFMIAAWDETKSATGRIGQILLGISALGMAIAAFFTTDPITTPAGEMTDSGKMHALGGQLNLTPLAVLFLTWGLNKRKDWKQVRLPLQATAVLTLFVTIGFAVSVGAAQGEFGPGVYAGLFGRLLMVGYAAWIVIASFHMLRLQPRPEWAKRSKAVVSGNEV